MNTFIRSIFEVFVHFLECAYATANYLHWMNTGECVYNICIVYVQSFKLCFFRVLHLQLHYFHLTIFVPVVAHNPFCGLLLPYCSDSDSFFFATSFYLFSFIFSFSILSIQNCETATKSELKCANKKEQSTICGLQVQT